MVNGLKNSKNEFQLSTVMSWDGWRYNFKVHEASAAFYRARSLSKLRWIRAVAGNIIRRTTAEQGRALENGLINTMSLKMINSMVRGDGRCVPVPGLKRAYLGIWIRLWMNSEHSDLPPVKLLNINGRTAIADDPVSRVVVEMARLRGMLEVPVLKVGGTAGYSSAVVNSFSCGHESENLQNAHVLLLDQ